MATKKAKKTSKKSAVTAPKVTTTVVSQAAPVRRKQNFFQKANKIKDLDGIFSASTLSLLFIELIGTMVMTVVFSFVISKGNQFFIMLILLGLGLALGHFAITYFNPIFTFGSWIANKISTKKMVLLIIAQVLGTMLAVILMNAFIQAAPETTRSYGQAAQSGIFKFPAIAKDKEIYVFFAEMLSAGVVCFLAAQATKRNKTERAVIVSVATFVGLLLSNILLSYIQTTGVLNPAMSIAIINFTDKTWQWNTAIYVIAPLIGGALGFLLDTFIAQPSEVKTTVTTA